MDFSDMVNYIISILSILYAAWQTKRNYNLKKYNKTDSFELYRDTDTLRKCIQNCLQALRSNNINLGIEEAGKVEGMAHALFTRSIKNIFHHFNYTHSEINKWISNKKIHEVHKDEFLMYSNK